MADARQALAEMRKAPHPLVRPVIVLGGYLDPGFATLALENAVRQSTGDDRIITVNYAMAGSFDECRKEVIAATDRAFACDDPSQTTEVDVVAVSMGGLVARYAACQLPDQPRRLRIVRVFTIATPHLGAEMADLPTLNPLQQDMRRGSAFLNRLNAEQLACELVSYVRVQDPIVGEEQSAPPGDTPRWVPNAPLSLAHGLAHDDPRIQADILRRLRGQTPFTTDPPAPLPPAGLNAR